MTEHEDLLDTSRRIVTREANRSHRLYSILLVVLLLVIGGILHEWQQSQDGNHLKDAQIAQQQKTISQLQNANMALTKKSAEQTTAEVQLRDDVNSFRALNAALNTNHTAALAVYCSIAQSLRPPDTLPPVEQYCPTTVP